MGHVSDRPKERRRTCRSTSMFSSRVRTWPRPRSMRSRKTPPRSSTDNGGKVAKTETWGLRSLAYRIAKNRKAHYVAARHRCARRPPIAELERQSNINEDVIRFLTIRVDEHEKGPSAMMRRGDKDRDRDRGPRGDRGDRGDRDDRPSFRAREEEVE